MQGSDHQEKTSNRFWGEGRKASYGLALSVRVGGLGKKYTVRNREKSKNSLSGRESNEKQKTGLLGGIRVGGYMEIVPALRGGSKKKTAIRWGSLQRGLGPFLGTSRKELG